MGAGREEGGRRRKTERKRERMWGRKSVRERE